jgi:hypothetical protein
VRVRAADLEALGLLTGEAADDSLNSHEPMLRCKVAVLLALLDGRARITAEDWALARVMWRTSCVVRQATVEYGMAQRKLAEQASTRRYVAREEARAAAVGSLDGKLTRLASTLADKAAEAGGFLTDGAARQKLQDVQFMLGHIGRCVAGDSDDSGRLAASLVLDQTWQARALAVKVWDGEGVSWLSSRGAGLVSCSGRSSLSCSTRQTVSASTGRPEESGGHLPRN